MPLESVFSGVLVLWSSVLLLPLGTVDMIKSIAGNSCGARTLKSEQRKMVLVSWTLGLGFSSTVSI